MESEKGRASFYFWMNCQFSEMCTQSLFCSIPEYFPAAVFQFGSFKWCLKDGLASTHCSNSRRWYLMVMVFFRSGTLRWRHHRSRFAAQVWNLECESSRKCPGSRKSESSRKSCSEANRISTTTTVKKDRPAWATTTKEATAKATTVAGTATVRFTDGNHLWGLVLWWVAISESSLLHVATIFFKYWHEAYISKVNNQYKLHSHNSHNLYRIGTVTARIQSNGEKLCLAMGLELTTLRSTMTNDNSDSVFLASLVPLYSGCLVWSS